MLDRSQGATLRRQEVVNRRRPRLWGRRLRWGAFGLALVVPPVALALWVLQAPFLEVSRLEIGDTTRVERSWLKSQVEASRGTNLVGLSLRGLADRLESHPWIDSVSLRKKLPSTLSVQVVEHRAVARWLGPVGTGLSACLGASGEVIDACSEQDAPGVLELSGYPSRGGSETETARGVSRPEPPEVRSALDFARLWHEAGWRWSSAPRRLELLGLGDYLVFPQEGPYRFIASRESLLRNGGELDRVFADFERQFSEGVVDLRFEGRIVIRPLDVGVDRDSSSTRGT